MTKATDSGLPPFLKGGGMMGESIRSHDWASTPIGPPETWPDELRIAVGLMLGSALPVYVAYGPELISFYNDGYLPIVGQKHPGGLGLPFQELWAEIWDDFRPMVEATLAGKAHHLTDEPVTLAGRPGRDEGFFTFSWTPLRNADGVVTGLYCTSQETTDRILAEREQAQANERLDLALSAGQGIGWWDWDTVADRVTADERFARLYGVDPARAAAGASITEFFAGIHPDDLGELQREIERTIREGGSMTAEYRLVSGDKVRWVAAQGLAILDDQGRCVRLPGVTFDITHRMEAQQALSRVVEAREFVHRLSVRYRNLADPEEILTITTEALGHRLGADRVCFARNLRGDRVFYGPCWTSGTLDPVEGEYTANQFGARLRQVHEDGVSIVYSDAATHPGGGLDYLASIGVGGGMFISARRPDSAVAGLLIHCRPPREWTRLEVDLATEIADLTVLAFERAEALAKLERRVALQETALAMQAGELRDQAERREAVERQLGQLQKMEALGQLTGGIAHDFNNMLAVVISGLNLVRRDLDGDNPRIDDYMKATMDAAIRAAALTRRLLSFARQSDLAAQAIDPAELVQSLSDLLHRTLGPNVHLHTEAADGQWVCKADPNQLENVIINLAVNARDAMPEGGALTIATGNTYVDSDLGEAEGFAPGQYALISVSDTGCGMPPEVVARAFEPFFTTKEAGKGTGLGLSQTFGFARQSGGHAKVDSVVGQGTTIRIYLPRFIGEATALTRRDVVDVAQGSSAEVILVVEDNDQLRPLVAEQLRGLGYTVREAAGPDEALRELEAEPRVSLIYTDLIMPGLTGQQLAERARTILPGVKILYTTGYAKQPVGDAPGHYGSDLLVKPVSLPHLATRLREILDDS